MKREFFDHLSEARRLIGAYSKDKNGNPLPDGSSAPMPKTGGSLQPLNPISFGYPGGPLVTVEQCGNCAFANLRALPVNRLPRTSGFQVRVNLGGMPGGGTSPELSNRRVAHFAGRQVLHPQAIAVQARVNTDQAGVADHDLAGLNKETEEGWTRSARQRTPEQTVTRLKVRMPRSDSN